MSLSMLTKTAVLILVQPNIMNDDDLVKMIKRQVATYNQVGINDIVIPIDKSHLFLEKKLARLSLAFLNVDSLKDDKTTVDSCYVYLKDYYERVFFSYVSTPFFSVATIKELIKVDGDIVRAYYQDKTGMPILFNDMSSNKLLSVFNESMPIKKHSTDDYGCIVSYSNEKKEVVEPKFHAKVRLTFAKEKTFFGPGTVQLLKLINISNSVRTATQLMGISYSKGWKMIKGIEEQVGYPVLIRQQGGKDGGKTTVSDKGLVLLEKYLDYEQKIAELFNKDIEL